MDLTNIPDLITQRPPASESSIAVVQQQLSARLPEEYIALLAITDGIVADRFILYSCQELAERNATMEVSRYAPGFVAIGDDNGGLAIVLRGDSEHSPVFLVGQGSMQPDSMVRIASSVTEWLALGCPTELDADD